MMASWDPIYPGEKVDWYSEYIARHSSLSLSWLEEPDEISRHPKEKLEMRGFGLLKDADGNKIVAPLDDGSVCLWSLGQDCEDSDPVLGRILTRSRAGLLSFDNGQWGSEKWQSSSGTSRIRMPSSGVVECVSIDSHRNKAYFAVQQGLSEIDLTTLQRSAYDQYREPISVISEASHPTPLTIGTTQALFIHDPRLGNNGRSSPYTSLSHCVDDDFCRSSSGGSPLSSHAVLSQPLPLSILHLPNSIYVAGRFPSILSYDRRFFPKVSTSIHSGARLSALSCLATPDRPTIVAAGEYNGKGSLEQYPLSFPGLPVQEPSRNRVSASRSKILSLTPHGKRLLFTDSDGQLTWVERDGTTPVRRWNINTHSASKTDDADAPQGIFNASLNDGDVVRKLLPISKGEKSEVCVWTGEKIGVLSFQQNARFAMGKDGNLENLAGSSEMSNDEKECGRMMRRALERQADEVRFIRGLGLSS